MGLLNFKGSRQRDEWCSGNLDPLLAKVLLEACEFNANKLRRGPLVVTDIWRSREEDEAVDGHGMHPAWRAVDVDADSWDDKYATAIATFLNARYVYDKLRPRMKVAFFEPHGTAPHLHLQVHPATEER